MKASTALSLAAVACVPQSPPVQQAEQGPLVAATSPPLPVLSPVPEAGAEPGDAAPAPPPPAPWVYVLPNDHGVRRDGAGQGHFLAPRYHGKHNGIDLLAPLGTPLFSPCDGRAKTGVSGSFGKWVQVVCEVPEPLGGESPLFASIFYSHLKESTVPRGSAAVVDRGAQVGTVGKSGNASGPSVVPHVHLELIVHPTEEAALKEMHSGRDQSNHEAADAFFGRLRTTCLEPNRVASRIGLDVRRARRADPFIVLGCLGAAKPEFELPGGELSAASVSWPELYDGATKLFAADDPRDQ